MDSNINPKLNRLKTQRGYYYRKILFSVLLSLFVIIILLSAVMFVYSNSRIKSSNEKMDEMTRNHMLSSIEYLYDSADTLCKQIYASKNAKILMYLKAPETGLEMVTASRRMNEIRSSIIDVDNYVDSFVIYSETAHRTYYSKNGLDFHDPFIMKYVDDNKANHKDFILREIRYGNVKNKVLTFPLVDLNHDNTVSNGVFVNINLNWLNSKLNALIDEDALKDSCMILLDKNWNQITYVGTGEFATDASIGKIKNTYSNKEATTLHKTKLNGEECYVSTIPIEKQEMLVVRVQRASLVDSARNTYLIFAITALFCCIILSVILASVITNSLYKPIEGLAGRVKDNEGAKTHLDEIELLNQAFDSIGTIREDLDDSKKKIALYETFTSLPSEESDIGAITELKNLKIDPDADFTLAIVRVDNDEMYDQSEYSVELARKLTSGFDREIVRLDILTTVCIVQTGSDEDRKTLIDIARTLCRTELDWQTYIIAIGSRFNGFTQIRSAYEEVNSVVERRYFAEERDVLLPEVRSTGGCNVWNDPSVVFKAEEKLIDALKSGGDSETIEKAIDEYLAQYKYYEYSDMGVFRSHLIQSVKDVINQVNPLRSIPVSPDYKAFDSDFFQTSTVSQLRKVLIDFMTELSNELKTDKEDKYADLVKLIQDTVEREYSDTTLCLASISESVNLSPNYVGKLFKARTGMSVSAYITDVRLTHAAELIENSSLKINTILEQVGFINQSSFYKSFKQKYTVTPKDYIIGISNKKHGGSENDS